MIKYRPNINKHQGYRGRKSAYHIASENPTVPIRHLRPVFTEPKRCAAKLAHLDSQTPMPPRTLGVMVESCRGISDRLRAHITEARAARAEAGDRKDKHVLDQLCLTVVMQSGERVPTQISLPAQIRAHTVGECNRAGQVHRVDPVQAAAALLGFGQQLLIPCDESDGLVKPVDEDL
jgi:hypothetical protein